MALLTPKPTPDLPAGFSFAPEDDKMLSVYLCRRIAGEPLPGATGKFFHDADIYAAEPATLAGDYLPAPARKGESNSWFFFSSVRPKNRRGSRKSRTVGDGKGTWHSERAPKGVFDGEGRLVGHRQSFSYKPKNGDKSEWLMTEFGVDQEGDEGRRGEPETVLCKIYQSPRMRRSASNSSSLGSARKRNATGEHPDQASSAPVRRRLFPSPPAPTPPAASQDKYAASESPHDFLMSVEPEAGAGAEAEESQGETSTMDHCFFIADHARSPMSFYGTTHPGDVDDSGILPCAPDAETPGSWTWGHIADPCLSDVEFLASSLRSDEEYWRVPGFAQDSSYRCSTSSALDSPAAFPPILQRNGLL